MSRAIPVGGQLGSVNLSAGLCQAGANTLPAAASAAVANVTGGRANFASWRNAGSLIA